MIKVYVVTGGSYSDYSIERIFLQKENADKYAEIRSKEDSGDYYKVEEYETSDYEEIQIYKYIEATLYICNDGNTTYSFDIYQTNSLDSDNNEQEFYYNHYFNRNKFPVDYGYYLIEIKRPVKILEFNEEKLKEKYKKVCEDLWTKIQSLRNIEGWDDKMIIEWLGNYKD